MAEEITIGIIDQIIEVDQDKTIDMMIGETAIDVMIEEIVIDRMIGKTIIDKTKHWTITGTIIDKIMVETINRDIELEVKVGRILEIIIEIIQGKDLREVDIGVEIDNCDQEQECYRMIEGIGQDQNLDLGPIEEQVQMDRIRCYGCREYDHFAIECLNTATDEELDHSDIEQVALQMLMRENIPISSEGQAQVECLNL